MEDYQKFPRNNQTRTVKEPYSRERLENLKNIVSRFRKNGKGKRYSIIVDGEMVIPKTDDPEQFDEYLDYVDHLTYYVEVRTYFGNSPNCNIYRFDLREATPPPQTLQGVPQLGALEVQEKIQDALSRQRLETDILLLEREKAQKDEEILNLRKKLKGYKKLQAKLDEKQIDISELFTKGIELFGAFQAKKMATNGQVQGLPSTPPSEVEITPESLPSEVDQHFEDLKTVYSEKQLMRALQASELFAKYPELRGEFQAIVNAKIKQNE